MSGATALSGWMAAVLAGAVAAASSRSASARMEAAARACHELRGPITAARLGIELGVRAGQLSPERLRAIELELASASAALDDLAGTHTGGSSPRLIQAIDVRELLEDIVEGWRSVAQAHGTDLRLRWWGADGMVVGERIRLAQAVGNLIANAAEHGGGEIEVRGRSGRSKISIEVADSGVGLPASVAVLAARARGGHGMRGRGLAIASAIAEHHGGKLIAAPSANGATVMMTLPKR